jgi:hypothetical protein
MTRVDELRQLILLAEEWGLQQACFIQNNGRGLTSAETAVAARVGVARPDLVRIALVDEIPAPEAAPLRAACEKLGFLGADTVGLTLGHGIYLRKGRPTAAVVAHELLHVAQYEAHGSIEAYLSVYIPELLEFGYEDAPMERDARAAETSGLRGSE